MSDVLQENALYGQANALKLDLVARAIKVTGKIVAKRAKRKETASFGLLSLEFGLGW